MKKGFSLIELLIVIGILLIMSTIAMPIYSNLQVSSQLNESTDLLIQTLRTAKTKAISRENDTGHGIKLGLHDYTLYQGISYDSRNSSLDRLVELGDVITLTWSLGGEDDITFSQGKGEINTNGTITLTHDTTGTKTIIINSAGTIEEE